MNRKPFHIYLIAISLLSVFIISSSIITQTVIASTGNSRDISSLCKKRVELEPHYSNSAKYSNQPILTQNDFPTENTIYVIKHNFVLTENINIPVNCILDFEGGSLRGGTIIGNNTSINNADYSIFNDCVVKKFTLPYVDPRWVGAIPDFDETTNKGTDNSSYFQRAYDNIIENHPGSSLLIIGKYYIAKPVLFKLQCNIKGFHNNSRGMSDYGLTPDGSSNSLIAVGDCAAIKVVGNDKGKASWSDFSIEHVKFLGINRERSIAIQYESSGSPARPSFIEKCEACNLHYFLYVVAKNNSTIGNLTINGNNIYRCDKAIYAISEPAHKMGFPSLKIENNVIEHNGDKCIHLNRCFGPIIIDNNILEGEANPIYMVSTHHADTYYVIKNNYFEYSRDDDKKIHIDGVINEKDGLKNALYTTNVEIYGNTTAYGFAVELNGVVVKRLDRIDTPSGGKKNYSKFTRCLFEDVDISDVYSSQFDEWNFATHFPTSAIKRNNSQIGDVGNSLLSFDDCRGNAHTNSTSKAIINMAGDSRSGKGLILVKFRPQLTANKNSLTLKQTINNKVINCFSANLPREIPYYAFRVFRNTEMPKSSCKLGLNVFVNGANNVEMSNFTLYKNVTGQMYNYPQIIIPYSK